MPSWIPAWAAELLREHWRFLLISWLGMNAIQTMPSPAEKGPTSSALYKWLFGFMHLSAAAVPRVIYTLFPQLVKFLPFNGMTQPGPAADPQPPAPPSAPKP